MEAPPPQLVDPEALEDTATGVGVAPRRPSCLLTEAGGSRGLQGYRGRGRRIADSLADALPGESGGPRSVRLPHGAPHLFGAPQPSDDPLLDTVGTRLRSGTLFPIDRKSCARRGSGKSCAVCDLPITDLDIEYEVSGGSSGQVGVHLPCYLVWRQESKALRA
jgi:hypothetical protein